MQEIKELDMKTLVFMFNSLTFPQDFLKNPILKTTSHKLPNS